MTTLIRAAAAALVLGWPFAAAAQIVHETTATSTARVELAADGTVIMHARNALLVPYALFDGDKYHARLATITTDVISRTDAEGEDPKSTVAFVIEDLSGAKPQRLADFTDPGSVGLLVGERYGVATIKGCCGGVDIHRVRALETGRALFRSTGDADLGSAAWAEAPNAKPRTVRWAAFDGEVDDKDAAKGLLGHIVYGSDAGPLSTIELRAKARDDDLSLELSHSSVLVWIDPKPSAEKRVPSSGEAGFPQDIWAIEGKSNPAQLGGFSVALMLGHKRLVTIPIDRDRLVPAQAKTQDGITVSGVPEKR
jgi:hypothetical protein